MSRWPARTGVLVHDETAYFAAGLFPDEGTAVYAVDARTGQPRWEKEFNTNRKGSRTGGFVPDGAPLRDPLGRGDNAHLTPAE